MSQRDPDDLVVAEDIERLQKFIQWEISEQSVTLGILFALLLVINNVGMILVFWTAGVF